MATPCLSIILLSLLISLRIHPALGAVPRFGAVNDATLLAGGGGGGFAPRWYMGTPALPAQPLSPNPRHALSGYRLGARQSNICPAGQHSCVEVNSPGTCCMNDRYCYYNENWEPMCCPLGVQCPDSKCGADQLYCNTTSTTTVAIGTTSTGQQSGNVTSIASYITSTACCNRACKSTAFSCEPAFGGQCCKYDFKCASGGSCISDPAPSTSTSISTIVSEVPSGCITSQITCAQTEGGGCCNSGSICTFQSVATATSAAVCAPDPTPSDDDSSNGLSSAAKAGIGVGVAVGAAIIIAAVTWLCIRQRRRSGTTGTASMSAHEMRGNTVAEHATGGARSGVGEQDVGNSLLVGPMTPWTLRSGFSDPNDTPLSGHGHDYIGPDAIEGPFTDRGGDEHPVFFNPGLATTPPAASGDGAPYHPDHILRPVEIGASEAHKDIEEQKEDEHFVDAKETPAQDDDPTAGPFELMGSLGTPSPLNSDELGQLRDKGPSPSSPV
ncbi:hypothetical protein F4860DRAFT_485752 [Xylaria cubensis]|nr:hypothetical protein F4860DRAFT_485752 [Xylaria cubensis]